MGTMRRTEKPAGGRARRPWLMDGYTRDQKLFVWEAMLINSGTVITGGAFLTALLLLMKAPDMTVGLVVSSGSWSLMLSLVSSLVVERVRRKRALLAAVALAFRLLTALPVFLPALMGTGPVTASVAAVMIVLGNMVFSLYNTGFNIFFMDSIPIEGRTPYIYTRIFLIRISYTVLSLVVGFLLDEMQKSYLGFIIVFSLGLALGVADAIVINMIQGKGGVQERDSGSNGPLDLKVLVRQLVNPLRNRRYVEYLLFTFAYFFFLAISSSYTSLYLQKYLNLSIAFISIYNTATYVIMIAVTRLWARLELKIGRLNVVAAGALLMSLEFFVYGFLTTGTLALIVLSPLFSGLGSSGFWASVLPYRYDLMPAEGKNVYEGWYGTIFGAAGLLGALVGGKLQIMLSPITLPFMTLSVFQLTYFLSGILALLAVALFWRGARKGEAACRS